MNQKQISKQEQTFVLKNIGVLASSVFRTSLAIQRYSHLITEQQNRLKAIMTSIDDGILLLENDGSPIIQNEIGEKFFKKLCTCKHNHNKCLIHNTVKQIKKQALSTVTRETAVNSQTFHIKFHRIHQENHTDRISLRIRCLGKEGQNHESNGIHDITPIIREMAAAMAHEVNNPLTPIIGLSSPSLIEEKSSDDLEKEMKIIHRSGERIADVIDQLLDFDEVHRCEEAHLVHINTMIRDIVKQTKTGFKTNNIRLMTRLSTHSLAIHINEAQLRQVIIYILNSIRANKENKETVSSITLSTRLQDDGTIRIHYDDPKICQKTAKNANRPQMDLLSTFRDFHLILADLLASSINVRIQCENFEKKNTRCTVLTLPK